MLELLLEIARSEKHEGFRAWYLSGWIVLILIIASVEEGDVKALTVLSFSFLLTASVVSYVGWCMHSSRKIKKADKSANTAQSDKK